MLPTPLPAIPAKRYFTIGEVSELCGVKPYVLRYWEQEFTQLKPMKRRGNRRYYQHHEVLLIRRIRELLYDEGFTISGARNRLAEAGLRATQAQQDPDVAGDSGEPTEDQGSRIGVPAFVGMEPVAAAGGAAMALVASPSAMSVRVGALVPGAAPSWAGVRDELLSIRQLLTL